MRESLLATVFEDLEIGGREIGDRLSLLVRDDGVHLHEIQTDLDDRRTGRGGKDVREEGGERIRVC